MENLIYSLNATIPIFLVMVLGYLFYKGKLLNDNFVSIANKFVFQVALPVMLFCDLRTMDLEENFSWPFVGFCFLATFLMFTLTWIGAELAFKDKQKVGSFVQGACRGSAAILGIAFVVNMFGSAGMTPLMIFAAVPLFNVFSVAALCIHGRDAGQSKGTQLRKTLLNILKNPIIISILIGLVFAFFRIPVPEILDSTLNLVGAVSTPLALIAIGAGFSFAGAKKVWKPAVAAVFIKLIALPAVFLPIAAWMGFRNQEMIAVLIMLGSPTTPTSYIMAKQMAGEGDLSGSIVVIATLCSAVTLTGWIFVLKSLGMLG